jgi:hypothetical protein
MTDQWRVLVLAATVPMVLVVGACAQAGPSSQAGGTDPTRSGQAGSPSPGTQSALGKAATRAEQLSSSYPDWYAGVEITGDRLVVYRVPGSDLDGVIRAAVVDVAVEFRDAPYSHAKLTALAGRVVADSTYWAQRGVPIWSVNARHDGTGIEVGTSAGSQLLAGAKERYGDIPIIVLPMSSPPVPVPATG